MNIDLDKVEAFAKKILECVDVLRGLVPPSVNGSSPLKHAQAALIAASVPVAGWRQETETPSGDRRQLRNKKCEWCGRMFAASGIGPHQRHCVAKPQPRGRPIKGSDVIRETIVKVASEQNGRFTVMDIRKALPTTSRWSIRSIIDRMVAFNLASRHGRGTGTFFQMK